MRSLLAMPSMIVIDRSLLLRALEVYEVDRLDFAEAYLVAYAETTGVAAVASFDRSLDRVADRGADRAGEGLTWQDRGMSAADILKAWERAGTLVPIGGHELFVVDAAAAPGVGRTGRTPRPCWSCTASPPAPSTSRGVLPALRAGRRVVLFDLLGFGQSAKPDQRYSLFTQADLAEGVVRPPRASTGSTC